MGSGCVIVTFKMLDGDFIFLFSYLIPFSTQHLTVMKKKPVMFFPMFFFKGKHWC